MDMLNQTPGWLFLLVAIPLFLWIRGIVRGSKSDLVAAVVLQAILSFTIIITTGHSGAFAEIGGMLMLFGVGTLAGSSFARTDCFLTRDDRLWLGMLLLLVGLLASIII